MRRIIGVLLLAFALPFAAFTALAGPFVRQFPIQKQTTLPPGKYTFTFLLFTTPTWGTPVFSEKKTITLTSPTLTHVLGSVNKTGLAALDYSQQHYLQVMRAGSDTPVVRREPFFVVPYAIYSDVAGAGGSGDVTGVAAGDGLMGGGSSGEVTIGADYGGDGSAVTVSRSDHTHAGMGTIGTVTAGDGLTGGGSASAVTLHVGQGSGLTVGADSVSVDFEGSGSAGAAARSDHFHPAAGANNTAVGELALYMNSGGTGNTALAARSLFMNTLGSNNTAVGYSALHQNSTGDANTAVGISALEQNTTGGYNTAVGGSALGGNLGGEMNTAVGTAALASNSDGSSNAAFGRGALAGPQHESSNTAIGTEALFQHQTGSSNTALGYRAGCSPGMEITAGAKNTYLGALAGPVFGATLTNATAVGADVVLSQSDSVVLGNNASVGIGTATPKAKVEVAGGGILLSSAGQGIILKSSGGACVQITATDAGGITASAVACP